MSSKEEIAALYEDYHMYTLLLEECKSTIEIIQNVHLKDLVEKLNEKNKNYEGNYENEIKDILLEQWPKINEICLNELCSQIDENDNTKIKEALVLKWTQIKDMTKSFMDDEAASLKNVIKIKYAKKVFDELQREKQEKLLRSSTK